MLSDEAWTQQIEKLVKGMVAPVMTKPQQRHLWLAVVGLIGMLQRRTLTGLSRQPGVERHESSVKRFMTASPWDDGKVRTEVRRAVLAAVGRQPAGTGIELVIDDTVTPKYGRHMEGLGRHYCNGQIVWGHCKVTLSVVVGEVKVPWDFRIYVPKSVARAQGLAFATKLELAREMLAGFPDLAGRRVCVLFDSFYLSKALLAYICQERRWDLVARIEANRKAYYRGRELELPRIAAGQSGSWWEPLSGQGDLEGGGLKVGLWHGIRGQLVMTRRDGEGLEAVHYLVTNRRDLSALQVVRLYARRWYIETYHRDAKQLLGLAHYQMRCLAGLRRHWLLVDLAYTALRLQACSDSSSQTDPSRPTVTLGSLRRQFRVGLAQQRIRQAVDIFIKTRDYQLAFRAAGCPS